MWHWWAGLSSSLRAGDVALVDGFIGIVGGWVMWQCGVIGDRGIDELTLVWPNIGQSLGCSMAAVLATHSGGGGGGEGKDGMVTICDMGDISNVVARFGNPWAPINN